VSHTRAAAAGSRSRQSAPTLALEPSDVFINVPFDRSHENIFLALIAGLVALGFNPRSVLEVPPSTDRLRRLYAIISACPFSLHDLSRVQRSGRQGFRVPRFNMPFELGIAAAVSLQGDARHEWRILERVPHRVSHSLSDVAGYDASIHGGTVRGTIDVLLDIFDNVRDPPLSETEELLRVYRGLRDFRSSLPRNCYTASAFRRLVVAASVLVDSSTP
jgi:hypothetical protein